MAAAGERDLDAILRNAAKYSPVGTAIVTTATAHDGGVAVRVADEGPGLGDGPAERLFDPFYRTPDAVRQAPGAGIGLFVSRELVAAMGGRIWARPAPSGGAEFGLWLPSLADEAEPAEA